MEDVSDPTRADRLSSRTFTSALSINEFAACAELGLEPVQLVQGYAVLAHTSPLYSGGVSMTGQRFGPGPNTYLNAQIRSMAAQGYWKRYRCPHVHQAITGEHLIWGANAEQLLMHSAWKRGYSAAFSRMLDQAKKAGAHGVIGVRDARRSFIDTPALEYRVVGTAVRVANAPDPKGLLWTTSLSGQPLVNLIAGGFMPVSSVVERTWIAVWPYCLTKFFLEGQIRQRDVMGDPVQEVDQVSDAKIKLLDIALAHVRAQANGDPVYAIDIEFGEEHLGGSGAWLMDATIRGTRLGRFGLGTEPRDPETLLTLS